MTKEQKARAHLARAQELIQDTLAFGVKKARIAPGASTVAHTGVQHEEHKYLLHLTSLPDEAITKVISDGELDGAQLIMLMQVGNDDLNRIIKDTLVMKSKRYNDVDIFAIKDLDMVKLLVKHGDKRAHPDLFNLAILRKNRDLVTALLEAGEDVNQSLDDDYYTTPLMWAVNLRSYDIAKILIDYGADVNKKVCDYDNPSVYITPLDLAFRQYLSRRSEITGDEFKIVKYLLEKGADPNMMVYLSKDTDDTEPTPLYKYMKRHLLPFIAKERKLSNLLLRAGGWTL